MDQARSSTRVALVTGGARRIGRVLALDLARAGFAVAVHFRRSEADALAVVAEINAAGGRAAAVGADLGDVAAVRALVPRITAELGAPSILVNNASEFRFDDLASLSPESWALHLATNLTAPVLLTQSLAQHLPDGAPGLVVNMIDQRVLSLNPDFFSYTVSKAALWDATRMLAQALAPRVRVNAIGPGPTLASVHQTTSDFETERRSTLLGRGTSPEEIATALRFILDAPAMTGQMIALDGGQHLAWAHAKAPASRADSGDGTA